MATLKQVAERAGVSTATVSLALNNGPVSARTRERVAEIAREMNYVPNALGRSLTTGSSRTLQLLTLRSGKYADTARETSLFHYIQEGFLSLATQHRYGARFDIRSVEESDFGHYLEELTGGGAIDGLAVITQFAESADLLRPVIESGLPYVLLQPEAFGPDLNWVDMGNVVGGRLVGELFATAGAKSVAFINGPKGHVDALQREQGFRAALAEAGIDEVRVIYGDFTIESGYAAVEELIRNSPPDSLFCGNDYMAAGALRRLHEGGFSVPDEVAVVGYDDSDICLGVFPTLTSVNNQFLGLGRALAQGLLDVLDGTRGKIRDSFTPVLVKRQTHRRGRTMRVRPQR